MEKLPGEKKLGSLYGQTSNPYANMEMSGASKFPRKFMARQGS